MESAYRFLAWRRIDVPVGYGAAGIGTWSGETNGVLIEASEMLVRGARTQAVWLNLNLDLAWRTESVFVHVIRSRHTDVATIERAGEDRWVVNGRRRSRLDGCVEIDVAATPLTNTMAIRRLALGIGEEAALRVAWVEVPTLRVVPAEQGYRRLGPIEGSDGLEAYEFWPVGGRTYRLTVDADGLVLDYEDFAKRVAG